VTIQEYLDEAEALERELGERLATIDPATRIDAVKGQLRDWRARLDQLQKSITTVSPDGRREAGIALNRVRRGFDDAMAERESAGAGRPAQAAVDLTMPARARWQGGRHPVTMVIREIQEMFRELGFTVALGPEAETEWYNFGSLNFPSDHPAMDAHDTLYLGPGSLLRTPYVAGTGAHDAALGPANPYPRPGERLSTRFLRPRRTRPCSPRSRGCQSMRA
jgi:phenylalanyl-tRNA synthetase alpha chain